jgi:hypothetical protein
MRTTCRIFLASILLMGAIGIASAQDGSAPPPSPAPVPVLTPVPAVPPNPADQAAAPDLVVTAVPDLAPIPGTQSDPATVEPVVPASSLVQPELPVEPVAVPAVNPPALEKLPASTVTTKRVTKKTAKKPAEKPATLEADSTKAAGAAASAAAVDTTGNTPPPPPAAAASTAPAASIAPPPASEARTSAVESSEETPVKARMGTVGWILLALGVVALFAIMTILRRRRIRTRTRSRTSIVDHETPLTPELQPVSLLSQELKPALVPRP